MVYESRSVRKRARGTSALHFVVYFVSIMERARKILIIKTGSTMESLRSRRGDFEDWILDGMDVRPSTVSTVDVHAGSALPEPAGLAGIVITGSHDMVTQRLEWSEKTAAWLRDAVAAGVPTLGICYGHQLLAHALGGVVGYNPRGPEMGTSDIELLETARADALFEGLPPVLKGHESHSQSVLSLPRGAVRLATNEWDENQAFRVDDCAWGVQFHPEFDADIMRAYAESAGVRLRLDIVDAPCGRKILQRFVTIARA